MPAPRRQKAFDLELLQRLKDLSWLSAAQAKELALAMAVRSVKRNGVIFQELGKPSTDAHILLSGAAQLSHLNGDGPRVVAMIDARGSLQATPDVVREIARQFDNATATRRSRAKPTKTG